MNSYKAYIWLACLFLLSARIAAQSFTCPSPYIFLGTNLNIGVYDPAQPLSASNPSSTGIPLPAGYGGITFMPNINGGSPSPTFYVTKGSTYWYWNGTTWINTGHSTGAAAAVNIGGCGSTIYNLGFQTIYTYNGSANGSSLVVVPMGAVADVVVDCSCNFYIFNPSSPQNLSKYSPSGALIVSYPIVGIPLSSGGGGFGINGNDVYYTGGLNLYKGTIGSGPNLNMVNIGSATGFGAQDWANCPTDYLPVTGTLVSSVPTCSAPLTITAQLTGNPPYTYTWSGPGIAGPVNGSVVAVTAGISGFYTCNVGTSGICSSGSLALTTSVTGAACISVSSSSITCASLGSATVTPLGGAGPFSYTWMPGGQTGSVAVNLTPGTYSITVFDAGVGGTYTSTTVFTSSVPLSGTVNSSSSITCNGASTGSASVTNLSGGSPNQTYLWSNGVNSYTVPHPTNLSAGIWSITVSDVLTGCQINQTFFISQPPAITVTLSANTPSACAGFSIALTGTASGGTPHQTGAAYSYSWTAGAAGNSQTVSQSLAGNYVYTLNATDSLNCSRSGTIPVTFVANPTIAVSNVSICPLQTGTLVASGASSYTWNAVSPGSSYAASPPATQEYTVMGSALGCTALATASIVLKPVPTGNITQNGPVCQASALVLSASGGASYSWSGINGFNSVSANNTISPVALTAGGAYNVTITAANACTVGLSTTVAIKPLPVLSISPNSTSICLNTNSVILTANGTATLFSWLPLQGLSSGTTQTVNAFPSATTVYTLTGTLNGCSKTAMATVNVVPPPNPAISLSSGTTCAEALSGSANTITLTAGGATSYTISTPNDIFNSNPGGPITNLNTQPPHHSGVSTATLYGSNGACTISTTAVFTIVPNPTVSISSSTPVICAGQSFTYTSAGANSYTWSSGTPGQTLYTSGNVSVASPTITAMFSVAGGSLGCNSALQTHTILVNPLPVVSLGPVPAVMCLNSPITLSAFGTGTLYSWSPSSWLDAVQGSTVSANPPVQQSYTVLASLNTCTASAMITVLVLPLPQPVITTAQNTICLNQTLSLGASGGITYSWTTPNHELHTGADLHLVVDNLNYSGIYTVVVTGANGCRSSATTSIALLDNPSGYLKNDISERCVPFCERYRFVPVNYPMSDITSQSWLVNNLSVSDSSSFTQCYTKAGEYILTGKIHAKNGCANTVTMSVSAYPQPLATFTYNPQTPVESLDEVRFTSTTSGQITDFSWHFMDNTFNLSNKNQSFDHTFETAGTYPVALIVNNQWGCSDTVVRAITVAPDFAVYVPNAFTPNADGHNESFRPVMRGISVFTFYVFNRWGEKLFETSDPNAAWDGTHKGELCPQDTYAWKLEVSSQGRLAGDDWFSGKKERTLTGQVTLYR